MDLGYLGPKFTWSRHFVNGSSIWERLDTGLATNDWFMKFPRSRDYHLQSDSSNHGPILLVLAPLDLPPKKKPFLFEEMWLSHPSCEETVQAAWYFTFGSDLSREILPKVEKCGSDLSRWNGDVFGSVRQKLNRKQNLLALAESKGSRAKI
ncbi:hypothetical protein CFP56_025757 [Quercus suber]|uniref:Endonuclease/exonuclease/phosphatase n=1 Tax=Quercus suber TaxID=58331 RepID=A0AAW0K2S6_QUESU